MNLKTLGGWLRTKKASFVITIAAWLIYAVFFIPLHSYAGDGATGFSIIPVAVTAGLFGLRWGIAAGLVGFGLNTVLLMATGTSSTETLLQHGGIVNLTVLLFTGGMVGWMRDSRSFIRQNLRKSSVIEQSIIQESLIDEALSELSSELLKPIDLNEISNMVLKSAMRLTHSGFGYVGYIDPETGHLVSPAIDTGIYKDFPLDPNQNIFKKFNGLWGWVLVYKKSLLTNNAKADPRASGTLEKLYSHQEIPFRTRHHRRPPGGSDLAGKPGKGLHRPGPCAGGTAGSTLRAGSSPLPGRRPRARQRIEIPHPV